MLKFKYDEKLLLVSELATLFNISVQAVNATVKRKGLKCGDSFPTPKKGRGGLPKRYLVDGQLLNISQIAKLTKRNPSSVSRFISDHNIAVGASLDGYVKNARGG